MHKLKEMLMRELKDYESKLEKMSGGKLSAGDLQTIHMMTDTIKNICKIDMLDEETGYSEDGGNWQARGSYNDGSSYARGRGRGTRRDPMGRYSRDDGYSEDNMRHRGSSYNDGSAYNHGGMSYDDDRDHMVRRLKDMMKDADSEEMRQAIKQCIRKIEQS